MTGENIAMILEHKFKSYFEHRGEEPKDVMVVIGISGGIDSAVVAEMCCRCGFCVYGRIMDCESDPVAIKRAVLFCKRLVETYNNFGYDHIDLTGDFKNSSIRESDKISDLGDMNLKSRLRMCALRYKANVCNGVVVGTGNKTEYLVGYFTKEGDGGCDIFPIADLYKYQVYELARYYKIQSDIIEAVPSADLASGQTDEKEMGVSYGKLDTILESLPFWDTITNMDNYDYQVFKSAFIKNVEVSDEEREDMNKVMDMCHRSAHKRKARPILKLKG